MQKICMTVEWNENSDHLKTNTVCNGLSNQTFMN